MQKPNAAGDPLPYVFAGNVNAIFGNWTTYLGLCLLIHDGVLQVCPAQGSFQGCYLTFDL